MAGAGRGNFMNIFTITNIKKIRSYAGDHKFLSAVFIILFALVSYWGYGKITSTAGETRYITAVVEKGTIVSSISGSGQVSALDQVNLTAKASGDVVYVGAKNGDQVSSGVLLVQLDDRDAQKAVRDAEAGVLSAQLSMDKIIQPADVLSTIQTENALAQASSTLEKAYDDGFNSVSNTFIDAPTAMSGLYDVLYGTTFTHGVQDNISAYGDLVKDDVRTAVFKDDAVSKYKIARKAYDQNIIDYRLANRTSDRATIEALVNETYNTSRAIAESLKSSSDFLNFVKDRLTERLQPIPTLLTTNLSSLITYTGQMNSNLVSLLGIKNTITSSKYSIAEKTESLAKLIKGADTLDIQSAELSLKQKQNALLDAREKLSNYYIRAPFSGTVAKLNFQKGDSVSNGATVVTFITPKQFAQISLNEVDVAKIKVGQKATLTFDAVDGLTMTGVVSEVDTVGTVTQGVVTYNVKIVFDTEDSRIKPGMSVSTAIITEIKQDVLVVPNSAIKSKGNTQYVEVFDTKLEADTTGQGVPSAVLPRQANVVVGISDDTSSEITSGLSEGEQIVVRTTTAFVTATQQAPSILSSLGGSRTTNTNSAIRGATTR